ncbi:hypothetical protein J3E69DRAFT_352165 [Trichoderma sp. SZMC 28015]
MSQVKVLVTGASGYIGGSVLQTLVNDFGSDISLSALLRSKANYDALKEMGVNPIYFNGLHDLETIKRVASEHQVVVSCASSLDVPSCLALVEGLGIRKQDTAQDVFYIHTSGTSNFGDHPITQIESRDVTIRTDKDDNYEWEKNNADTWPSRKVDVTIIEAGERFGVKTIITNPPLIYGRGNGIGNQRSIQIPALVEISLKKQQAIVLDKGEGLWTVAHISDVAAFYSLVLKRYLEGQSIDSGKSGYYFLENGEISWLDISKHIAEVGYSQGLFPSKETKEITLEDFSEALAIPHLKDLNMIEVVWGSNARISAVKSREIGWKPQNGVAEFYKSIEDEVNSCQVEGTQG